MYLLSRRQYLLEGDEHSFIKAASIFDGPQSDSRIPLFIKRNSKKTRSRARNLITNKTKLCKDYDKQKQCFYGKKCHYAHCKDELNPVNFYNKDRKYKEKQCPNGDKCDQQNTCKLYHNENEKRFNIMMKRLSTAESSTSSNEQKQYWTVQKNWLRISETVLQLSLFSEKETEELIQRIIQSKQELCEQKVVIKGIQLNLCQTQSDIDNRTKWGFIQAFRDDQNFFFKSESITYVRISKKRQISLSLSDTQFTEQVCAELTDKIPQNLKLMLTKGMDWEHTFKILNALKNLGDGIFKLELNIADIIGCFNQLPFESALRDTLLNLPNLKVLQISLQFYYPEQNGYYEKDTISICLGILREMMERNSSLDFSLNIQRFIVAKRGSCVEIKTQPFGHFSDKQRKEHTKMLSAKEFHCLFMLRFAKLFMKLIRPDSLVFDFSFCYGLVSSKNEAQMKKAAIKYEQEVSSLMDQIIQILQGIPNKSIMMFQMKFFSFSFWFKSDSVKRVSWFKLISGNLLPKQNKPFGMFQQIGKLAEVIRSKLNVEFKHDLLQGNIFTPNNKQIDRILPQGKQFIEGMKNGNAKFLSKVMGQFENLKKIQCRFRENANFARLLMLKKTLIDVKYLSPVAENFFKITEKNNELCLLRAQIIAFIRVLRQFKKKYPLFTFRKEIVMRLLGYSHLGCFN